MSDLNNLSKLIEGDVSTWTTDINNASHDASLFEVKPVAVIFPKNVEDVKKLVRYVTDENNSHTQVNFVSKNPKNRPTKLTLTARSAGTDMSGGPLTESLVVDFTKNFNHLGITENVGLVQRSIHLIQQAKRSRIKLK